MRAALVMLLLASPVLGDERIADPGGRHYVVLRASKGWSDVRFTIAEIGPEAPPVESEAYGRGERGGWHAGGGLRECDRVVARGGLDTPPYHAIVSTTGMGFVAFERGRTVGSFIALTIVPAKGPKIARRLTYLPPGINALTRWWLRGAWLDDGARKVVVVSRTGTLRAVRWDDGDVTEATDADVVRALALPYPAARTLALELAAERRLGARQAVPVLLDAICAEDECLAEKAAEAAIELSGDEIAPELTEALRRGTKVPHVVARFFEEVRHPEVVPLLVAALEDPPEDVRDWRLESIVDALRYQTGKDFGWATALWREWLDTRKR